MPYVTLAAFVRYVRLAYGLSLREACDYVRTYQA